MTNNDRIEIKYEHGEKTNLLDLWYSADKGLRFINKKNQEFELNENF